MDFGIRERRKVNELMNAVTVKAPAFERRFPCCRAVISKS